MHGSVLNKKELIYLSSQEYVGYKWLTILHNYFIDFNRNISLLSKYKQVIIYR